MWASFASLFDYSVRFFNPIASGFLVEISVFILVAAFFVMTQKLQVREFSYIPKTVFQQILLLSLV